MNLVLPGPEKNYNRAEVDKLKRQPGIWGVERLSSIYSDGRFFFFNWMVIIPQLCGARSNLAVDIASTEAKAIIAAASRLLISTARSRAENKMMLIFIITVLLGDLIPQNYQDRLWKNE